jgi:hypothetical protein
MDPELWDTARRRLTLLLDPGRIKRGLAPNAEAGYPLTEGVPVVLSVGRDFRDAGGRALRAVAERTYRVGPAVRRLLDPSRWRRTSPVAGSSDPLVVDFDRPLDHALLLSCLTVTLPDGTPVEGYTAAGAGEGSWRFVPRSPWAPGRHLVVVDPRLEDLAGNSLLRVFDRDLTRPQDAREGAAGAALPFVVAERA